MHMNLCILIYSFTSELIGVSDCLRFYTIQVKTWFQNRRMKQKRKRAEDAERRVKLSFLSSLAHTIHNGHHGYQPDYESSRHPTYTDTPLVLRSELPSKYACPPASPWSSLRMPYYPPLPPPYWGRYPGPYWTVPGEALVNLVPYFLAAVDFCFVSR